MGRTAPAGAVDGTSATAVAWVLTSQLRIPASATTKVPGWRRIPTRTPRAVAGTALPTATALMSTGPFAPPTTNHACHVQRTAPVATQSLAAAARVRAA